VKVAGCEFCDTPGGAVLWQDGLCRVVRVDEPDYPGFLRVILQGHATELSDLPEADHAALMGIVRKVELAVREAMRPDKMNVASLGNMTPHVHWHVIPRFRDDRHFSTPIWGPPQRDGVRNAEREARAQGVSAAVLKHLGS
jgi:diadenosine tetraphosphate (Ap4A) HIT family hydrolase